MEAKKYGLFFRKANISLFVVAIENMVAQYVDLHDRDPLSWRFKSLIQGNENTTFRWLGTDNEINMEWLLLCVKNMKNCS